MSRPLARARTVRRTAPNADLYVLDGLFPDAAPAFDEIDARPVLGSLLEIQDWADHCARTGEKRPAAIHIDTGMNRLGLRGSDVDILIQGDLLGSFESAIVMSHLACADDPENPMNEAQRSSFDTLRAKLLDMPACFANSGGIFRGEPYHYDMVRPGISLYGGRAVNGVANPMQPVVTLQARIVQLRDAEPGETVGYGATRKLTRPTRIATVACGYADGLFRRLSAGDGETGLSGLIGGHLAPILGRVSMDTITLNVTDIPAELTSRGALVELLGHQTSVDDLADLAGTIGYEVLTSLGRRYQRVYTGNESTA